MVGLNGWFAAAFAILILQRGAELAIARRHARWIRRQGGYEVGRKHYPLLVGVHLFFLVGLALEVAVFKAVPPSWWPAPFALFLAAQGLRVWCIRSLGPYWNTRVMVAPGHRPVVRGPYRYLRHPNYVVVVTELLTLPLVFGAFVSAAVFTVLNLWILLKVRIPAEERVLTQVTPYREEMENRGRFLPRWMKTNEN